MKLTLILAFAAALSLASLILGLSFEFHAYACYALFAIGMAFAIFIRDYTRQRAMFSVTSRRQSITMRRTAPAGR
jgi:membrane protein YdbS with pleckstrin-like domain